MISEENLGIQVEDPGSFCGTFLLLETRIFSRKYVELRWCLNLPGSDEEGLIIQNHISYRANMHTGPPVKH